MRMAPTSAAPIADAIAAMLAEGPERFRDRANGLVHETSWHGFASAIVESAECAAGHF